MHEPRKFAPFIIISKQAPLADCLLLLVLKYTAVTLGKISSANKECKAKWNCNFGISPDKATDLLLFFTEMKGPRAGIRRDLISHQTGLKVQLVFYA